MKAAAHVAHNVQKLRAMSCTPWDKEEERWGGASFGQNGAVVKGAAFVGGSACGDWR